MAEILMPRDAGKYIAANSKDVKINEEGVKKTAELVGIRCASELYKVCVSITRKLAYTESENLLIVVRI